MTQSTISVKKKFVNFLKSSFLFHLVYENVSFKFADCSSVSNKSSILNVHVSKISNLTHY